MKRNVWRMAAAGLFMWTIGVFAQDRGAQPQSSTVTVVGCMQQGERNGSVAGTGLGTSVPPNLAGPAANSNEPVGFLLTDATSTAAPAATNPSPTGTAGDAAANRAQPDRTSYALEGDENQFLDHKGHRVEVTGTLAPPMSSGAGTGRPNDPAFKSGVQRLRVSSIKMIAADCKTAAAAR
jgi:hypothetical protein